jgi:hypothetical protein
VTGEPRRHCLSRGKGSDSTREGNGAREEAESNQGSALCPSSRLFAGASATDERVDDQADLSGSAEKVQGKCKSKIIVPVEFSA